MTVDAMEEENVQPVTLAPGSMCNLANDVFR